MVKKVKLAVEGIDIVEFSKKYNFAVAKIYVVHDGLNKNDFIITKEALEKGKNTLINTPLIGKFDGYDFERTRGRTDTIRCFPRELKD